MTNKTPGANADLPCVRENFPNHKRRDLFQQKTETACGGYTFRIFAVMFGSVYVGVFLQTSFLREILGPGR